MTDTAWIKVKSRQVLTYTVQALSRLGDHPCAAMTDRPLAGMTAVVVGAGPSLREVERLLPELQHEACIITVNASTPAVEQHVTPDILVARESLDISKQVRDSSALQVVLDVGCHPALWDAAGERCHWWLPGYPRHMPIGNILGCPTPYGGTAALTSAVSMARHWGASTIYLLGVDLAYAADGATYHHNAPRGAETVEVKGDKAHLSGTEYVMKQFDESGQVRPPEVLDAIQVPGQSGPVWTQNTWKDQIDWLERFAEFYRGRLLYWNGNGAKLSGWRHVWPGHARMDGGVNVLLNARKPSPEAVGAVVEYTRSQCQALIQMADIMLKPGHPNWEAMRNLGPCVDAFLAEGLGCVEQLDAEWKAVGDHIFRRELWKAWRLGAERTLDALEA